jgi:hypothetical protein
VLTIKVDTKQVERMLKGLSDAIKGTAIREAVNKAAAKGNTEMKRRISREFNIKAGEVGGQLDLIKAGKQFAAVTATILALPKRKGRRARNVIEFIERKVTLAEARRRLKSGTRNLLRYEIRRGRKVTIPGSFIVTANRGTFVAQRQGKTRFPIQSVQTIDVPQMFNTQRINREVVRRLEDEFLPQEIDRAIQYALKRYGK